jgi:putative tryptophan/tyrosine transport system substrate-binding protein
MRRREFIALIGGTMVGWSASLRAQQFDRLRRIAVLMPFAESDRGAQSWVTAFREELGKLGWAEGHNIEINTRWATADVESIERLAKELITLHPDLILTSSTPVTAAMLQQTRTIPIIFVWVGDPIGRGFVASLAMPGGNATGFTPIEGSLGGKWVELLKEIAPRVARVVLLFNPSMATFVNDYLNSFKAAAASRGMQASVAPVHDMSALESVIAEQARELNSGLVVVPDAFTIGHRAEIISLVTRYRVPAIYWSRSFTELGGLISYGPDSIEPYRRAASYADRILKGEKPSELPVQAPVKFELVINLKIAKALGFTIPPTLLATADEVIE